MRSRGEEGGFVALRSPGPARRGRRPRRAQRRDALPHTDTRKPRGGWEGSSGGRGSARGWDPVRDVSSVTGLRGGATHPFLAWDTPGIFSPKAGCTDTQRACSQPTSFYRWPRRKEENGGFVGKAWRNCSALHVGLRILVDQKFADPGRPLIYPHKAAGRAVGGGRGGGSDPE